MTNQTLILEARQIQQKINRIAHQILEENHDQKEVVLIGIKGQGSILMNRLATIIEPVADFKLLLGELTLDKDNPLSKKMKLTLNPKDLEMKNVILIDDVLNSGKTLMYATVELLTVPLKRLQTAILIDRKHRRFPIRADFVGLTLSTTLQEHIAVNLKNGKDTVYLE